MSICPVCQFENVRIAKFCIECGLRLTTPTLSQQERKKVTVLFADVSGFTKLSESMDPEELADITAEIYKVMGAAVYKYGGTVDKYLGDGVMVLFGAPVSHENDNERALLCALEIRRRLHHIWQEKGLDLQISGGVNAGVVISGKVGDAQRQDYTALGDVVNVAKRFEEKASSGQILVSESVYQDVKNKFVWKSLDPVQVKGKSEKLKVRELVKVSSQKNLELITGAGLAKLVGREEQIRTLKNFLDRVNQGQFIELGLLGEAGLGKSRMLYELRYHLGKTEIRILRATGAPHAQSQVFSLFESLIRNHLSLNDWEDEKAALESLEQLLIYFQTDENKHERIGALAYMMGYHYPASSVEFLSSEQREAFIQESIMIFLKQLVSQSPVLLIFDNLQWSDRASARLLQKIRNDRQGIAMGILLVGREEEIPQEEIPLPSQSIRLKPFNRAQMQEYLSSVLVSLQLPKGLVDLIFSRSRGNPFFAEELIKKLLVEKIVQRRGSQFVLTQSIYDLPIPQSLQELLMSRVDLLDAQTKRVIQCAAVLGETFPYRVLKLICDSYGIEVDSCLEQLIETQLVSRRSSGEEAEYVFANSVLKDVAYDSLLRKDQRDIHLKTAHAFEEAYPDRIESFYNFLSEHYEKAGQEVQAAKYLLESAEHLFSRGETNQAREALVRIRGLKIDPEANADLYLDQIRLQLLLGIGLFQESLEAIESDDLRVLLRISQMKALVSSDFDAEALYKLPSLTGEACEVGIGNLLRAWAYLRQRDFQKTKQFGELAQNHFVHADNRVGQAMALEALGLVHLSQGEIERAKESVLESLKVLGSDFGSQIGWLRLRPLSHLLGEQGFLDLIDISSQLDALDFVGQPGYFLEDSEVAARQSETLLLDKISKVLQPLLSRHRDALLRVLSFCGQADLVVRPCAYWILIEQRLPDPMNYLATPGTFLAQISLLVESERQFLVNRKSCGKILEKLVAQTQQKEDGERADILGIIGSYYTFGPPDQRPRGKRLLQRAITCLQDRPQTAIRSWALERLQACLHKDRNLQSGP